MDERMEFLRRSIASHDRQIGELAELQQRTREQLSALARTVEALGTHVTRFTEKTQLNFDRLTTAMLGLTEHAADHRRRLENPER